MLRTISAKVNAEGKIELLEKVSLTCGQKLLVTVLEKSRNMDELEDVSMTAILSEPALAEDWNRPEEDEAWQHLQTVQSF